MFGRAGTEEMEITEFESDRRYLVEADGPGVIYRTEFLFNDAEGGGTSVTMTFSGEPTTAASKVLSFLTRPLSGAVRKAVESDLRDMKVFCESGR